MEYLGQQILVEVLEHSVPIILLLGDLCCNNYQFLRSKLLFIFVYSLAYLVLNVSKHTLMKAILLRSSLFMTSLLGQIPNLTFLLQ